MARLASISEVYSAYASTVGEDRDYNDLEFDSFRIEHAATKLRRLRSDATRSETARIAAKNRHSERRIKTVSVN